MRIDTVQGMARAIERLARRDPKSLAAFIVSLAHDAGPIGDQVRTMIVGDDVTDEIRRARLSRVRQVNSVGSCLVLCSHTNVHQLTDQTPG